MDELVERASTPGVTLTESKAALLDVVNGAASIEILDVFRSLEAASSSSLKSEEPASDSDGGVFTVDSVDGETVPEVGAISRSRAILSLVC